MNKIKPSAPPWILESQLALETYLDALESEEIRLSTMERVLAEIRERLDVTPGEQEPAPVGEIRALFARYQRAAATSAQISQLVSDMRDE